MAKLRGVLVRPNESGVDFTFDLNSYKDFYPVLDCDAFDIVERKFGNNYYDIYVDDEGLLNNKETAIYTLGEGGVVEILVGNCFVCKHNDEGDTISLTDDEVDEILSNTIGGSVCCVL